MTAADHLPTPPELSAAGQAALAPGAALLDELLAALTGYVALPTDHADWAATLWIATTHALPASDVAPRLGITSPEKRCGKSRLLDVIEATCHEPMATADATVVAIVRSIGNEHPPTLLIDEADAMFGTRRAAEQHEDLRSLINAGHQRGRDARRCVGPLQRVEAFPTFAMAALAGIGNLPDTITDRAVNVRMQCRPADRAVKKYRRRRDEPALHDLRKRLAEWSPGSSTRWRRPCLTCRWTTAPLTPGNHSSPSPTVLAGLGPHVPAPPASPSGPATLVRRARYRGPGRAARGAARIGGRARLAAEAQRAGAGTTSGDGRLAPGHHCRGLMSHRLGHQ